MYTGLSFCSFTHSIIILFHVSCYKLASRARGIFLMRLSVEEYGVILGGAIKVYWPYRGFKEAG